MDHITLSLVRKIVEIERFGFRTAILNEYQFCLVRRDRFNPPTPIALGTYETKTATRTWKCSILTIIRKKQGTVNSLHNATPHPFAQNWLIFGNGEFLHLVGYANQSHNLTTSGWRYISFLYWLQN